MEADAGYLKTNKRDKIKEESGGLFTYYYKTWVEVRVEKNPPHDVRVRVQREGWKRNPGCCLIAETPKPGDIWEFKGTDEEELSAVVSAIRTRLGIE